MLLGLEPVGVSHGTWTHGTGGVSLAHLLGRCDDSAAAESGPTPGAEVGGVGSLTAKSTGCSAA